MRLYELIEKSALQYPDRIAIGHDGKTLTYRDLQRLSQNLALKLLEAGVRPLDRVGVWAEKSPGVVASFQAILRLGAAYVPIDPQAPLNRAVQILGNCSVSAIVTTQDRIEGPLKDQLPEIPRIVLSKNDLSDYLADLPAPPDLTDDTPAYILYTSGSTGIPKGISISHKNAIAFIQWASELCSPRIDDRFSSHAPFHFDLSILDLFVPFLNGASVWLVPQGLTYSPSKLVDFIRQHEITHWYSVPSAWLLMLEKGGLCDKTLKHLKVVLYAGEPFPVKHLRLLQTRLKGVRIFNLYGPTETNVCTFQEVPALIEEDAASIPIGKPCCGNTVWLAREDGSLISEPGETGEVIVQGPTVMLGYWGKEPVKNSTYSTGDLAYLNPSGELVLVGRKDHQVKIRGFRVDLGEIESILVKHPKVEEATILLNGDSLKTQLIACIRVIKNEQNGEHNFPTLLEISQHCAQFLPAYMIPTQLKIFTEFPRTSTGKTDRKALRLML